MSAYTEPWVCGHSYRQLPHGRQALLKLAPRPVQSRVLRAHVHAAIAILGHKEMERAVLGRRGRWLWAEMHWKRGRYPPPPPLQGAQPMPSHCPPDANCQPQWHLQPTATAPNRFGNLLQPPVQPLLGPPLRSLPF